MAASLPRVISTHTDPTGATDAIVELFALRAVDDLSLAQYVAGEPAEARHTMRLLRPAGTVRYRTLLRGEPTGWCDGLACAAGHPDLVPSIGQWPMPRVLTFAEAAELLPSLADPEASLSTYGVANAAQKLYPLYANNLSARGRQRYLFELDVKAEAAERRLAARRAERRPAEMVRRSAERARGEWLALRRLLPPPIREHMVEVDLTTPTPGRRRLVLDPEVLSVAALCLDGLAIAEREGWLAYCWPGPGGRSHVVQVPVQDGDGVRWVERQLPQERVLPWLLGVADWHGRPDLVAYRPGLT